MSVGLVALSTSAIAGPDEAAHRGELVAAQSARQTPGRLQPFALAAPVDSDAVPVLKHIASTGAQLLELGRAHGLRSIGACSGDKFMVLQIAPGGHAVVGGPQLDFSVGKLMALASGR